jgi:dipeptidyl aminopeptidase/acylaminoacyl peptidase
LVHFPLLKNKRQVGQMIEARRVMPRSWMAAAAFVLASMGAWAQSPTQVPISAFFEKPAFGSAAISPTGRHVAVTALNKDGVLQLVILDTATLSAKVAAGFQDGDVVNVRWVSDKRLVFGVGDREHRLTDYLAGPGLYAVDVDGSDFRQLARVERSWLTSRPAPGERLLDATARFVATSWGKDSDSIFVTQTRWKPDGQFDSLHLFKLDTRTGAASPIARPGDTEGWLIAPDNVPRLAWTGDKQGHIALQYLDPATGEWAKLGEFNGYTMEGAFTPLGFAPDGTLYVSQRKGEGTSAVYTYDLKKKEISGAPVLSVAGFDVQASLDRTRDRVVGVHYSSDARATYWFDNGLKDLQSKIDKLLPATVNRIDVPYRSEVPFVLVFAYSDAEPGQIFLFDTKADKLVRIGRMRPAIDSTRMARLDFIRFKARDGLEVPAWVTTPKDGNKGPHPMVVLVHGGPYVRGGYWGWDSDAQFLASRGYVVLEPEFRGSQGFGFAHFRAGWKQWGLAMQNDVADATRWAIAKGIADPKRICIAGASYGGYATLMGLVNDPDLYRCGVEWVGVTDIDLMYDVTWSDLPQEYKTFGMPVLVGDREKDAAQLKATSPLEQASRIKQPLLLAYGAQDRRVPLKHGTDFRDAVTRTNKDVEWVVYPDEGHGWSQPKDAIDFWTRVEKFLARNIGDK